MMRGVFIAFLFVLMAPRTMGQDSLLAQVSQPFRFEVEQKFSDEDYTVISLKDEGLALLREKNKFKSGTQTWELVLLDSILQEKQNLELDIDQRKSLIGFERAKGYLFLLFKSSETIKIVLDLISVQLATGEINRFEIKPELALQLIHFSKVADNFILGGYVNNEPAILLYDPTSDNLKVLPGFFQKQAELVDLRPNQNHTFNIILIDRGDRFEQKLIFKTFDATGVELLQDVVTIDEKYTIQAGLSSMLIREDLAVLGTWGTRNSKQSLGLFSLTIDPFSDQKIGYTAFGELQHYLDNQNPKRAQKIKEKTTEAIKQNRLPDFSNYVMPYRIDEYSGGFILLAEAYVPSTALSRYPDQYPFGNNPYSYYSPFWGYYPGTYNRLYNPYYNPNTIGNSEEIKATQSVLVAFDGNGKVLWDFSLNMEDMRRYTLEQIADFCIQKNKIYFFYKKESELMAKTINLDNKESFDSAIKIRLLNEGDEIRSEVKTIGGVRHWYGKNFYVWGQQTIRNRAIQQEGTRQVFYVIKIVGS